jgi:serine phosphatase RsbU (regulator of sigma subunit)
MEELSSHGLPLALFPGKPYGSGHISLGPDDFLFLYTDGITEAANAAGEEFGMDRLKAFLKTQIGADPTDVDAALASTLEQHAEGEHFADDRTLLILRRVP